MPLNEITCNPYLLYPLADDCTCGARYPIGYYDASSPAKAAVGDFYSNIAQDLSSIVPVRFNGTTVVSGMVLDPTGSSVTLQKKALYRIHYELTPAAGFSSDIPVYVTVNGVVLPQSIRQLPGNGSQVSAHFIYSGEPGDLVRLNVNSAGIVSLAPGSNVNTMLNITEVL